MRGRIVLGTLLVATVLGIPAVGIGSTAGSQAEGSLSLLQWPGYSDSSFARDFEQRTGCRITRRDARSSAEMLQLMRTGSYDLVSASGDITGELISRRLVKAVDVSRIPGWRSFAPAFRSPAYNTVGGVHYGVTVMWTPNQLLYNRKRAKPAPTSWRAVYDDRFAGKVSIPDNPMQIADAALYLRSSDPRLKIRNPYELTPPQFDAAVALLRRQARLVERYWLYASEQIQDFRTGATVVGSGWPYQAQVLTTSGMDVRALVPSQGATGWADSWLLGAKAAHPTCAYLWLRHVSTPSVQAQQALTLRESPVTSRACPLMEAEEKGSCARYYGSAPASVLGRIEFWKTPARACRGSRTGCVPYAEWQRAWARIRS
jgi:putative spermidine/putrescine transport system substrate-binding protein